ncbi:MAG: DUF3306 domain-containing protein [Piscirickettsiaceae bacterium]|nr:DUF3306 domain-containing protein [Piscirickettsiaceae bacterium]
MTSDKDGLLSRWSRRKLDSSNDDEPSEKILESDIAKESHAEEVDETDLPLWQQKDVDSDDKRQALASLFRQPEFKDVDHMNEYDEDFTQFSGLGDIVTQEMKRMFKVVEEHTRVKDELISSENVDVKPSIEPEDKEDNEIA